MGKRQEGEEGMAGRFHDVSRRRGEHGKEGRMEGREVEDRRGEGGRNAEREGGEKETKEEGGKGAEQAGRREGGEGRCEFHTQCSHSGATVPR